MKQNKTLFEEISTRNVGKVPFSYNLLAFIGKNFVYKSHKINVIKKIDIKKLKGPFIVVANHTSRADFAYSGIAMLPHRLTFISAFNEFFRSHLAPTLKTMQVIPKRSYCQDTRMIKEVSRILSKGGKVIIFPEGESSMAGNNQPMLPGSGKFLKHFKVPVISVKIKGGYLTNPKFSMFSRPGRVEVEVDKLFDCADLEQLSGEEIQSKLDEYFYHDDFEWNKNERIAFKSKGQIATNLHHLLYRCPKCQNEHEMIGEGDTIKCKACGNGAKLNDFYDLIPLSEDCVIPSTVRVWFDMQREQIKKEIADNNFCFSENVKLGMLNHKKLLKNKKTSEPAGEGEITVSHTGFCYRGTRYGESFEYTVKPENIMSLAYFTDMTFFAVYHDNEMYEFTPENGRTCKFRLAVEEMHRLHGGSWTYRTQQA